MFATRERSEVEGEIDQIIRLDRISFAPIPSYVFESKYHGKRT